MNNATICGIAVIRTFNAAGIPIAVPNPTPNAINHGADPSNTPGSNNVATTATAIPTAAILFPTTAVFGPVNRLKPKMNSENATIYNESMKFWLCKKTAATITPARPSHHSPPRPPPPPPPQAPAPACA